MGDNKRRVAFYVDSDDDKAIAKIKKQMFYDKSYAELYRYLVKQGLARVAEIK